MVKLPTFKKFKKKKPISDTSSSSVSSTSSSDDFEEDLEEEQEEIFHPDPEEKRLENFREITQCTMLQKLSKCEVKA